MTPNESTEVRLSVLPSIRRRFDASLISGLVSLSSADRGEPFLPLAAILELIPAESREKAACELATRRDIATDDQLTALLSRMCSWILLLPKSNLAPSVVTWVDAIVDQLAGERHIARRGNRRGQT